MKSGTTADRFDCDVAPITACSDGVDNDSNGLADYPDDPGCGSSGDDEELSDNGDGLDQRKSALLSWLSRARNATPAPAARA